MHGRGGEGVEGDRRGLLVELRPVEMGVFCIRRSLDIDRRQISLKYLMYFGFSVGGYVLTF